MYNTVSLLCCNFQATVKTVDDDLLEIIGGNRLVRT